MHKLSFIYVGQGQQCNIKAAKWLFLHGTPLSASQLSAGLALGELGPAIENCDSAMSGQQQ